MSSPPLLLVLPFLLFFFSSQSCQARRLLISPEGNNPTKEQDPSNKNQANMGVEVLPAPVATVKPIVEKVGSGKQEGVMASAKKATIENRKLPGLVVRIKSLSMIPWHVPHKGRPEPGFQLDYAPPKTHPPSHN